MSFVACDCPNCASLAPTMDKMRSMVKAAMKTLPRIPVSATESEKALYDWVKKNIRYATPPEPDPSIAKPPHVFPHVFAVAKLPNGVFAYPFTDICPHPPRAVVELLEVDPGRWCLCTADGAGAIVSRACEACGRGGCERCLPEPSMEGDA